MAIKKRISRKIFDQRYTVVDQDTGVILEDTNKRTMVLREEAVVDLFAFINDKGIELLNVVNQSNPSLILVLLNLVKHIREEDRRVSLSKKDRIKLADSLGISTDRFAEKIRKLCKLNLLIKEQNDDLVINPKVLSRWSRSDSKHREIELLFEKCN